MKKKWIKVAKSFKEAEKFNTDYYSSMSRKERLETMQFLREFYYKFKGIKNAHRKRLRRVIKVVQ